MEESLALFRVILSSDYFFNASVILFLNKTDLLPERLASKPLRYIYPEFNGNWNHEKKILCLIIFFFSSGADNDVEAAKEFIKNKYLALVEPRQSNLERNIYPHFTCSVG